MRFGQGHRCLVSTLTNETANAHLPWRVRCDAFATRRSQGIEFIELQTVSQTVGRMLESCRDRPLSESTTPSSRAEDDCRARLPRAGFPLAGVVAQTAGHFSLGLAGVSLA